MLNRAAIVIVAMTLIGLPGGGIPAGSVNLPGCADAQHQGGDWPSYGRDLANSRSQPAEDVIGPENVLGLESTWVFDTFDHALDGGGFHNTPVVAGGCVYLGTSTGWVFALNADTGAVVWQTRLLGSPSTLIGGVITGSVSVDGDVVYAGVSRPGTPYVAALDRATGDPLWFSVVESGWQALIVAGPVVLNGMVFQGFVGAENNPASRGGWAIVDASRDCDNAEHVECFDPVSGATGGQRLAHDYSVTDAEFAAGYRGASIWCTGAADADEGYVYSCTGNPQSYGKHARYSNSLLKIDIDPARDTFGTIVASYKGYPDGYIEGAKRQPACDLVPQAGVLWSVTCVELDLDFGASPNLFHDELGQPLVGNLQKAGVYHAAYADSMGRAWTLPVSVPCLGCNASSGAYADGRVFTVGSPPSWMVAIGTRNLEKARPQWLSPIGEGIHYNSVSHANGVVYTMDGLGTLSAIDAATGVPLLRRPFALDTGSPSAADFGGSNGVAIARNKVFAAGGPYVIAYGL